MIVYFCKTKELAQKVKQVVAKCRKENAVWQEINAPVRLWRNLQFCSRSQLTDDLLGKQEWMPRKAEMGTSSRANSERISFSHT